jgi:predicted RNA-binding Zn-ribbon protein involved in translation (DUF1610 family)
LEIAADDVITAVAPFSTMAQRPTLIDPKLRFDATYFDPRTEFGEHQICIADYKCPNCSYIVRFTTHDFYKLIEYSPFSAEQSKAAAEVRPLDEEVWEQSLDFRCPECELAVRVIFRPDFEFAMGGYTYEITAVVEFR